jgi:hypothetical protein
MARAKKSQQNKNKQNNDVPETSNNNNNNNLSSLPNEADTFDTPFSDINSPLSNFASTSNVFPTSTETSSEIPSGVK